jgi:hypothetical protein
MSTNQNASVPKVDRPVILTMSLGSTHMVRPGFPSLPMTNATPSWKLVWWPAI